ncbi:iron-sulfur cluster-binding protein [Spiribacter sp. C176]|uniref:Iron-sulfur cluster-binding protein n=1 Tax=Spiribacter salilacus TaxID=2664894 RepID=A0A6N7QX89_9GAMM|nr:LutB/LldF family L-lactate oxidation iron-sulfur protein [Spiribacter salilacus]MRH77264.1 iron-sulfur cluster-binding protein [Spiribacter salilacus]
MATAQADFTARAKNALDDQNLQSALKKARGGFVDKRAKALLDLPRFEALRERGRQIKDHTLAHLDVYLTQFERNVIANGGQVHYASNADAAQKIVLQIARDAQAKQIIKAKTMAGEEVAINQALEDEFETIESDLGEYIIQLAKEPPSHIIAPAVHKTRAEITALFNHHHHQQSDGPLRETPDLVNEARQVLREKFLGADIGISGANFLIAETGTITLVTNEGNADLSTSLPDVHIAIAGIEKLVPRLEDASTMLRLLARSATGQQLTAYTSFMTGARRDDELDGPTAFHVVLIDNGRSGMLGNEFREMLRCIRCGACMNHCPVYSAIGGHAYGWVYPGPMGAVLTPMIQGLDQSKDLPNACTLNGHCQSVCPVKIRLPMLIRRLRDYQFDQGLTGRRARWGIQAWAWIANRPALYQALTGLAMGTLARLGRGSLRRLPFAGGWTQSRDLPLPPRTGTFQQQWKKRQ